MTKKNFLLLSLDDDKAKKIANAINNPSCKKILDFLAENDGTETEISEKLKLPISTVHYNLQQLQDAKLVTWEKYHYSEKGKEVKHYTVANKYIVIVPKGEESGIREKLKSILPTSLLIMLGAAFIHIFSSAKAESMNSFAKAAPEMMQRSMDVADDAVMFAAEAAPEAMALGAAEPSFWQTLFSSYAFWFLCGALFAIFAIFIVKKIRNK